jgi:hypothetical protein
MCGQCIWKEYYETIGNPIYAGRRFQRNLTIQKWYEWLEKSEIKISNYVIKQAKWIKIDFLFVKEWWFF